MRLSITLTTLAVLFVPIAASAQTWVDSRTTPILNEIVAVDATGETGWLYGHEDLAGDGDEFRQQEQSIDIRTVYASTDSARFWVRLYVSDPNAAGGNVTAFVFIDADRSAATGGTAAAPEIHALLTADSSPGGYDYVLQIRGNGTLEEIWEWLDAQSAYQPTNPTAAQVDAEIGQDADPIEINGIDHGYLQGMVDLGLVGLTEACNAMLYVRSVHEATGGDGDLEVGQVGPCVPADDNNDGVPDPVEPSEGCTDDSQCPGRGICVNGRCVIPQACLTNDDCDPDEECSPEGLCVPLPGGSCTDNADCGDLVCVDGQCVPCTPGGDQCGPGRRCGADGRCVSDSGVGVGGGGGAWPGGIPLEPGDQVQGGALTCAASASRSAKQALALFFLALLGGALWRRRRG